MIRRPEPEHMDSPAEANAYAKADFNAVNDAFVARIADAYPASQCRAADLGTGPGDIPLRLAQLRPQWQITAYDASEAMLSHATRLLRRTEQPSHVKFVLADTKQLPTPDATYDLVFSNSLLHHMPDPIPFWQEIRRICKPDATIIVQDLLRPADEATAEQLLNEHAGNESALLKEEFYRSLLAAFTIEEVKAQLTQTNLSQLNVEQISDRHIYIQGKA